MEDGESIEDDSKAIREKLFKTLKKLPVFKLSKIRKDGLNGVKLNEVVGLKDSTQVDLWLSGTPFEELGIF